MTEREQLEQAIAHMEAQRAVLGDAVVDVSIAALRKQLAALEQADHSPTSELRGERRQATILLADVKGSTELAEQVDTETWVEIMNRVFHLLGDAIYRYGGEIDQYRGDGLLAFFGAKAVHEDDPERAVRAALAMQDAVKAYGAELEAERGLELLLRVGINSGEVIATEVGDRCQHSEDTAMGRAIALAARMESAAQPGTVLVTANTYRLAQPLFEWQALGEIRVKGVSQPVTVYRPLAVRDIAGKGRGIEGLSSPLVGRDAEFRALQEAIECLRDGVGGIVTLVGEAGLGKSRLVAELCKRTMTTQRASRLTPQWAEGRCLSYGGSIAYLLWLDVLRGLLGVTHDTAPLAVREALQDRVQALCPDCADDVLPYLAQMMSLPLDKEAEAKLRGLDGESLQYLTFRAVETLIEQAAQERPLVVVCEDLHWADPTSLALLERTLALTDRAPLLLICVLRPEAEHRCWRIRECAAGRYAHRYTELQLVPLSSDESGTLVGNLLRIEELTPRFRQRILEHAEGNPFFVEEIIRSLIDSGAIVYENITSRWHVARDESDIAIPDTLHGVLVARIDRLHKETRRVLQLASVIGRVFFYRVLAEIAREERELDARLLALQRQQLIRERARLPELEYIFKHHLTQEAAYNGLLQRERRIYHRRVAETLEQLFPDRIEEQAGLLAHHWERAGEATRAIPYLRRAGEQAAAQYANAEALDYFGRALELTPEEDLSARYAILLKREKAYDLLGEREAQRQDVADLALIAESLEDARLQAEAALCQAHYAEKISDYPAAIAAAREAVRLAQATQDTNIQGDAYLCWASSLLRQGDAAAARLRLEQALESSRAAQLYDVEAGSLRLLGMVSALKGDNAEAEAFLQQALRIYRETGHRKGEALAILGLGNVSHQQGDIVGTRTYWEQALRIFRQIGDRLNEGCALVSHGNLASVDGNYAAAQALYEQALRIFGEIGDRAREGLVFLNLAELFAYLGDYANAKCSYEQALDICHETGYRRAGYVMSRLGLLYHRLGDNEHAVEFCQKGLAAIEDRDSRSAQASAWITLGHARAGLGDPEGATDAYQNALGLRREMKQPHLATEPLAALARVAMAQGDLAQAQAHVEEILAHLESGSLDGTDEPFRIYLTCCRVLRANGDLRAEGLLDTAHRLLQEDAAKVADQELRCSFLENVAAHREIMEEFRRVHEGDS